MWHLAFAYGLAIPIGLDREQSQRHFGLRTFPLVAVFSGILPVFQNENGPAMAMGHEVAHDVARNGTERMKNILKLIGRI